MRSRSLRETILPYLSQTTQVPPYRFIDSLAYGEYAAATNEVFVGEATRRSPHNFTDLTQLNSLSR